MDFSFFLNSLLFGVGLAMDAFSVSLASGLNEPRMTKLRECSIAGTFSLFQIGMPLLGWFCVRKMEEAFNGFRPWIPWIALVLLLIIGGKMLVEGIRGTDGEAEKVPMGFWSLMLMGVATSIDALSVGFTISEYYFTMAVTEALIIGATTFLICILGIRLGRSIGTRLAGKASVLGGVILILIGIEICVKNLI